MMQKKKSRELLQIFKLYYGNNLIDKTPTMKKRERILIIASLFSPVIFAQEIPLKKVSDNDIQSCRTFPAIKDRVMNDRLDRNSKGIYRIGDYYNVDGKEGIVFYVDDTGKHGKIISMQTTILPWSTINTLTGANDMYDGRKNMEIIRKIPNWEQQFPAFNYCYNHLGHQWYLPAYYELKQIYINKNILVSEEIIGDVKEVLGILNRNLKQQDHGAWLEKIRAYKEKYPLKYHPDVLTGPFIVEEIYRQTKGDALIVTEVGQHQMWAAQYYKYTKPRTLLTSGGLGTMGYGLGASMGAKVGCPDKTVVNIAGDGCFRMNMNEIATAVRHNIPIIEVVVNNHVLGMVRQWQDLFYDERYSATVLRDSVDFAKAAEAMGAVGIHVETQDEFKAAFEKALSLNRPVVIDCQIGSDDKVWPMVAPGADIKEAFDEEDMNNEQSV